MRHLTLCGLLAIGCVLASVRADDKPKADEFTLLKRADLEKLEGVWEIKVDTKGWKGTIQATITLNSADSKKPDFGRILYDYDLGNGRVALKRQYVPRGGV